MLNHLNRLRRPTLHTLQSDKQSCRHGQGKTGECRSLNDSSASSAPGFRNHQTQDLLPSELSRR